MGVDREELRPQLLNGPLCPRLGQRAGRGSSPPVHLLKQVPDVALKVLPPARLAPLQAAAEILNPGGELGSGHAIRYSRGAGGVSGCYTRLATKER